MPVLYRALSACCPCRCFCPLSLQIREREYDITRDRIQKILDAGANVVLTTKGIDDMALKYFVEAGCLAVRRVPKDDLK
jgi:T-complex protein 1 subunit alpha